MYPCVRGLSGLGSDHQDGGKEKKNTQKGKNKKKRTMLWGRRLRLWLRGEAQFPGAVSSAGGACTAALFPVLQGEPVLRLPLLAG